MKYSLHLKGFICFAIITLISVSYSFAQEMKNLAIHPIDTMKGIGDLTTDSLSQMRGKLVDYAQQYLGVRYRTGGTSEGGFDCSGFTRFVYGSEGINIPHGSKSQAEMGKTVPLEEAKPGDIIFFGYKKGHKYRTSHAALVYSNENGVVRMIHASRKGIVIDSQDSMGWKQYYQKRILFVKDILTSNTK